MRKFTKDELLLGCKNSMHHHKIWIWFYNCMLMISVLILFINFACTIILSMYKIGSVAMVGTIIILGLVAIKKVNHVTLWSNYRHVHRRIIDKPELTLKDIELYEEICERASLNDCHEKFKSNQDK